MQLTGEYAVPAPRADVWKALNDPAMLQVCIDGCERLEWTGENQLEAVIGAKVGPLSFKVKGHLWLTDVVPGQSYVLNGKGEGRGAGSVEARAEVRLEDMADGGCRLIYVCDTNLGGMLATVGNKLVQGVADRTADQFFERFIQRLVVAIAAANTYDMSQFGDEHDVQVLQSEGTRADEILASVDGLLSEGEHSQPEQKDKPKELPRLVISVADPRLFIIAGAIGMFVLIILLLLLA